MNKDLAIYNASFLVMSSLLVKILGLIFSFFAARILGVELFGRYNFTWAYVGIFQMLSDFGLANVISKELGKENKNISLLIGPLISLRLILGLFAYICAITLIFILSYPNDVNKLIILASLLIFPNIIENLLLVLGSVLKKIKYFAVGSLLSNLLFFIISLLLILNNFKLNAIFINALVINLLFSIFSIIVINKKFVKINFSINFKYWKQLLKKSIPFAALSLLGLIYFKIDVIILSKISGDKAVGYYSSAYKFLEAALIISSSYSTVILPIFSNLAVKSPKKLINKLVESIKIMLLLGITISIFVNVFSENIIVTLFGNKYIPSVQALKILIWAAPLIFVSNIIYNFLYSINKQNKVIKLMILTVILNIFLNIYLVPKYSFLGSSYTTVISEIINLTIGSCIIFKFIKRYV